MAQSRTRFASRSFTTPHAWTFETLGDTPPSVRRTDPAPGAADVPLTATLTVCFDQALRVSGGAALTLTGPDGGLAVGPTTGCGRCTSGP